MALVIKKDCLLFADDLQLSFSYNLPKWIWYLILWVFDFKDWIWFFKSYLHHRI